MSQFLKRDEGSFRDPTSRVFTYKDKILRQVDKNAFENFEFVNQILEKKKIYDFIIETKEINIDQIIKEKFEDKYKFKYFEHKKLDFISYPYEWSFNRLKDAALHHLNLHINLLEEGATLVDGSSYNIQFINYKPVFIDVMSIKKYKDGEFWYGHKQFCESFLNPLILKSKTGIDFNNWFKGNLEGIKTNDLNNILKFKHKLSWNIFYNVVLLNHFEKKKITNFKLKNKNLKKKYLLGILKNLLNFIEGLEPKKTKTNWQAYSTNNTYNDNEKNKKENFILKYFRNINNKKILDLGCNNGQYSLLALKKNNFVVGLDFDLNVIDEAYRISKYKQLNFLPLYFDASNPSTNIGWNNQERKKINDRSNFDIVIALAFKHHLSIAKNIPLKEAINWITSFANQGIIEFVPKEDPTIREMLKIKGDIFPFYNYQNFRKILEKNHFIIDEETISNSGRTLISFKKK